MATVSWISTTGGDWSDGANWDGGVVPGASDIAVMDLSNAETVTISDREVAQSVSFDDPAATFVETASGKLIASGNVSLDASSIVLDGGLSSASGNVSLVAESMVVVDTSPVSVVSAPLTPVAGVVPNTALIIGSTTPITISPIGAVSGTIEPAAFNVVAGGSLVDDWFATYQPIITVAPSTLPQAPPALLLDTAAGPLVMAHLLAEPLNLALVSPVAARPQEPIAAPTVTGAGDGAMVFASGIRPEALAAGAGNETLIAGAASDTCVAGSGTTAMIGGSGPTTFLFENGSAGGTVTISNFLSGQDFVELLNYGPNAVSNALAAASVAAGSTTITLTDNSRVTFLNVTDLTPVAFR